MHVLNKFYIVRPCKSIAAFESVPKKKLKLNLNQCARILKKNGYEVINAKIMLIVSSTYEVTIYPSGKLLLKTDNMKIAEHESEKIYKLLEIKI
jgi:hypothetical protein